MSVCNNTANNIHSNISDSFSKFYEDQSNIQSNTTIPNKLYYVLSSNTPQTQQIQKGTTSIYHSSFSNISCSSSSSLNNDYSKNSQIQQQNESKRGEQTPGFFPAMNPQNTEQFISINHCQFEAENNHKISNNFSSNHQLPNIIVQNNMKEENSSTSNTSSPLIQFTRKSYNSQENKFQIEEESDFQDELAQKKIKRRSSESSESSQQVVSLIQRKKRISKEEKNSMKQFKLIPSYKILPIDYDDLPINEFHLYNDILICLQDSKFQNSSSSSIYNSAAISKSSKQINFFFQWKYINQMQDTKRELIFYVSNKTETKKDFDTIIKLLKVRNQSHELGKLLIEAESRLSQIQNTIRESFDLMKQNGLMDLYLQRRQLFEKKCEFFLKEIQSQKKYMYVKSYYNEEKCEIEDTEMGVSSKLVEFLTCSEVGLMIYKIMRGNYPEIFGNKLKDLWSKQSVMRLLNFEHNNYNEVSFENMELTTMDGFIFPATMTVKRVQFKYDPIFANLPLQDKFLYIEFNISPKVIQQINKMRREFNQAIPSNLNNNSEEIQFPTIQLDPQTPRQKSQSEPQFKKEPQQNSNENSLNNKDSNKNTNNEEISKENEIEQEKDDQNKFNIIIDQPSIRMKSQSDMGTILQKNNKKLNAFNVIKSKKRKQRGFVEENEKDFYYEMQSQVFLDKFYDYLEIQELIKQSEQDGNQEQAVTENPQQTTTNQQNILAS